MSLTIWISGAAGLILVGSLFYGTLVYVSNSGSTLAKYTVKKNSTCLSLKNIGTNQTYSSTYIECMSELEMLVKNLIINGEVSLQNCTLDTNNASVAYCQVVTWYSPKTVIVTDSDSVSAITKEISNSTTSSVASDSKRRKRNVSDTDTQIVDEIDEDIIVNNLLGKIQTTDSRMQRKLFSIRASSYQQHTEREFDLYKQKLQIVKPTWTTEIRPLPEPAAVSEEIPENFKEYDEYGNLIGIALENNKIQDVSNTKHYENQLEKKNYDDSFNEIKDL